MLITILDLTPAPIDRFNRHEWNKTFDAIDDLAKADQLENQSNNLIIGEI